MTTESQEIKKSTHVRVYTDKKERVERIARKMAYQDDRKVKEMEILDGILDRGLSRLERKLGIA